jgi:spermidine/putrescine transport system substrate-binding protein
MSSTDDSWKSRLYQGSWPQRLTGRRQFLQLSTAALSGIVLSNCARNLTDVGASPATSASPAAGGNSADNKTLHIYTWSTYTDDQLLKDFQAKTGIKVIADIYDSNETMLAKIQAGGGAAYSVIYPSDYMVTQMVQLKLLASLDQSRLPSVSDFFNQWKDPAYDPNNEHSYPFTWGTTGIIYNPEMLNPGPTDWQYLWDHKNDSKLKRHMTLLNDQREVFGIALKSLGYSSSTKDPNQIKAAYQKLVQLKPAILSFNTDGWRDQILAGDLSLAQVYSSDAINVISENSKFKYVIPSSGTTVWTDTIVIPKSAPNVDAAYQWINYVLSPETASPVISRLKLSTPNQKVRQLLPDSLKNNPGLFPSEKLLAKCEVIAPVGDATDLYDRYWTELTSG